MTGQPMPRTAALATDTIRIGFYEDWMFDQVIDLFVGEYGSDPVRQAAFFRSFYESPFQHDRGIRLVAVDARKTVCGFQSYFYWPYFFAGRTLRTFQSGNSLVAPSYRGRQIFARLLNFLSEIDPAERPRIECLVGFPVEMSYGSFIRNQWANPTDLAWYVRPVHPLSLVRAQVLRDSDWRFDPVAEAVISHVPQNQITLSRDPSFTEWRRSSRREDVRYLYLHHRDAHGTMRFELKPNRRGRITELVIGDIVRTSPDPALLRGGLRALRRAARGHSFLTMLSVALNARSADTSLKRELHRQGFIKLRKRVPFIVKPIDPFPEATDPARWTLLRSDIDTW